MEEPIGKGKRASLALDKEIEMDFGDKVRSKYVGNCLCLINGKVTDASRLKVRAMNFGQHWRTPGMAEVEYEVELPHAFFRDYVGEELQELVDDTREYNDASDPFEIALRDQNWPEVEEVVTEPELAELALEYFGHELLLHWLGDGSDPEETLYVLNTVDRVSFGHGKVLLAGKARLYCSYKCDRFRPSRSV